MAANTPAALVVLGRVAGAHGIKGWIKVQSHTEPPQALLDYPRWQLLRAGGASETRELRDASWDGRNLRVALEGIVDRSAAEALRGADIAVGRAELPAPAAGEYYRDDLLGCRVVNREGVELGRLSHFLDAPAQPVMVVSGARTHLIAAVAPHLRRVDLAARLIEVDWPAEL